MKPKRYHHFGTVPSWTFPGVPAWLVAEEKGGCGEEGTGSSGTPVLEFSTSKKQSRKIQHGRKIQQSSRRNYSYFETLEPRQCFSHPVSPARRSPPPRAVLPWVPFCCLELPSASSCGPCPGRLASLVGLSRALLCSCRLSLFTLRSVTRCACALVYRSRTFLLSPVWGPYE